MLEVQSKDGTKPRFWEVVFDIIKCALSDWGRKRRLFEPIREAWVYKPISKYAALLAAVIIQRAKSASGQNVNTPEGFKICKNKVIARLGPVELAGLDAAFIHRLRTGCLRDPDLTASLTRYNPMLPALALVWAGCINPVGLKQGRLPNSASASFLTICIFKLAIACCMRGLRCMDFLLPKEKGNQRAVAITSPTFRDVLIANDTLQIKIVPPGRLLCGGEGRPPQYALHIFEELIDHPDTTVEIELRGIKNRKEAAFTTTIEASKVKYRDACIVFYLLHIIIHRIKYYTDWNWDYIFSVPKTTSQSLTLPEYGFVEKGEPLFLPLTKPRVDELWSSWQMDFLNAKLYTIHEIRKGFQRSAVRADDVNAVKFTRETKRQAGNWKRPKSERAAAYAGHDAFLLDQKFIDLLDYDVENLLGKLPGSMQNDLLRELLWVCCVL